MSNSIREKLYSAVAAWRRGSARVVRAAGFALPQHCALCAAACGNALLCEPCARALPSLDQACPRCALPVAGGFVCGRCLASPPPFDTAVAAMRYAFPVDRLIQALKYGHRLALAEALADRLALAIGARCASPLPDAVVALPLSPARQRARGFNQAILLANALSARIGVPSLHALRRVVDAPPQAGLARSARLRNVRNAFRVALPLRGRHVAIVDDVMTTGATLAAAANALRRGGAARVDAWVVARALPPAA